MSFLKWLSEPGFRGNVESRIKALEGRVSAHTKSINALLNSEKTTKCQVDTDDILIAGKFTSTKTLMVVLPFCVSDFDGALNLLRWISELGGCPERNCMLLADCRLTKYNLARITSLARTVFKSVFVESTPRSLPDETWPIGPNWMFQCALEKIHEKYKSAFFWMEPDCIPLKPGWDDALQKEYDDCGKPFMGFVVPEDPNKNYPRHLSGWAIYTANAAEFISHFIRIDEGASYKNSEGVPRAWDVESAAVTVPLTHHSDLFYHIWGEFEQPPTFNPLKPGALSLDSIPSKAMVLHRCKDGSAITELRKRRLT